MMEMEVFLIDDISLIMLGFVMKSKMKEQLAD